MEEASTTCPPSPPLGSLNSAWPSLTCHQQKNDSMSRYPHSTVAAAEQQRIITTLFCSTIAPVSSRQYRPLMMLSPSTTGRHERVVLFLQVWRCGFFDSADLSPRGDCGKRQEASEGNSQTLLGYGSRAGCHRQFDGNPPPPPTMVDGNLVPQMQI